MWCTHLLSNIAKVNHEGHTLYLIVNARPHCAYMPMVYIGAHFSSWSATLLAFSQRRLQTYMCNEVLNRLPWGCINLIFYCIFQNMCPWYSTKQSLIIVTDSDQNHETLQHECGPRWVPKIFFSKFLIFLISYDPK